MHFIKGHASQAFLRRLRKNLFSGRTLWSGSAISPSDALHPAASALRADTNVNIPDSFQKFRYGKTAVCFPEALVSLERKNQLQVFGFVSVVQEAVIPDFLKARRQHMHQVAADEFRIPERDVSARFTRFFPPCRECDLLPIHRQNPAVGDGDFVCIPAKIFDGIAKSVEGFFDVGAPVFFVKGIPEGSPFIRIPELFTGGGESQLSFLEKILKSGKKFPLELIPEDFHPEKEVFLYFPDLMVRGQAAAGNNTVHMHMISDLLIPGMEYLDDPGCCAEVLFAFGKFQKCFGAASVEKAIEKLLVAVKQGIQIMRKGKNHMEVRGVNDFSPAFIHPGLFLHGLAVGAVAVTAGIIVEFNMAAVRALGKIDPKFP